uniref:G_PROTEIN_RECEP_F1_2 domain-containing protein n=1 Tax=Steinernema glaseri TaxID=37863 RepID=A0A1I8AA16_9BILA
MAFFDDFQILLTAVLGQFVSSTLPRCRALGCAISSLTIPVIFVIYFSRHLRSSIELVLVGGLLVADAVLALANAGSGIERMISIGLGTEKETLPISKCYFSPYVFMFAFCYQTIGLMTLAVSLERFAAVFFPLLYLKYTRFQGYFMVIAVFVFGTSTYLAAIPLHIDVQDQVSAFCFATTTLNPAVMKSLRMLRFVTVTLSVVIYVPVLLRVYSILSDKSLSVGSNHQVARLSLTIGLTSLAALFFVLIPDVIIVFDLFGLKQFHVLSYSVNLFKGVFNLAVYSTKHRALRDTLRRMLCCWKQSRHGSWMQ